MCLFPVRPSKFLFLKVEKKITLHFMMRGHFIRRKIVWGAFFPSQIRVCLGIFVFVSTRSQKSYFHNRRTRHLPRVSYAFYFVVRVFNRVRYHVWGLAKAIPWLSIRENLKCLCRFMVFNKNTKFFFVFTSGNNLFVNNLFLSCKVAKVYWKSWPGKFLRLKMSLEQVFVNCIF